MKKKLNAGLGICAAAIGVTALGDSLKFDGQAVNEVSLKNGSGTIEVTSVPGSQQVELEYKIHNGKCQVMSEVDGDDISIWVESSWGQECRVDMQLRLPADRQTLEIKQGSGTLRLQGEFKELEGKMGSGSVQGDGRFGKVELKSGSGAIKLSGLHGDANIKTGSGSIDIAYPSLTDHSKLNVKSGSGRTQVRLAPHIPIKSSYKSGNGQLRNQRTTMTPSGPTLEVQVKSGSGNLAISDLAH